MPRYHFESVDGLRETDPEGTVLADIVAARSLAVQFTRDFLSSDPDVVWEHGEWRVEVKDDDGELLFTLALLAINGPASISPITAGTVPNPA